jgi:glycosyltransferase involved in cell wall biosynthesis
MPGLRVLLVCEWFVKYTAALARGLADTGCEVLLVTRDHDLEFGGEPGAMREYVRETLGEGPIHLELGGRVRDPARIPDVVRLRRRCRRWAPDVVHIQDSLPHDMRLAVAAGFPRRRYAITVHDPAPHPGDAMPSARVRFLRRSLRRHARLLFVHSARIAEELAATGDAHGAVEVVPHGIGEVRPAPPPEGRSLIFFGRISRYKGLDVLLDAMPAVWAAQPDVTLTIAGEGELPKHDTLGDPRVALRAEHVPEEDVPELFAAASCAVLPYRQASQSGAGSEAKRFGRAVVATQIGGLPELVTPGTGLLVPPEDPKALAEAIVEVVGTPGLAAQMGRAAAESARRRQSRPTGASCCQRRSDPGHSHSENFFTSR